MVFSGYYDLFQELSSARGDGDYTITAKNCVFIADKYTSDFTVGSIPRIIDWDGAGDYPSNCSENGLLSLNFENCTFIGGIIHMRDHCDINLLNFTDCIFDKTVMAMYDGACPTTIHNNAYNCVYEDVLYNSGIINEDYIFDKSGDVGNTFVDPQFIDLANGDYRLKISSPLVGAASDGGDIGVYQTGERRDRRANINQSKSAWILYCNFRRSVCSSWCNSRCNFGDTVQVRLG